MFSSLTFFNLFEKDVSHNSSSSNLHSEEFIN